MGQPIPTRPGLYQLVEMTVAGYSSKDTRRVYTSRILRWLASKEVEEWGISRESVYQYLVRLDGEGQSAGAINQVQAAINAFVRECEARGMIGAVEAQSVYGVKLRGRRPKQSKKGRWLDQGEVGKLIEGQQAQPDQSAQPASSSDSSESEPDKETARVMELERARDGALLAMLLGCGLRRSEAVNVRWEQYRQIEGRMCLVDVLGKGAKLSTLPVPDWAVELMDAWEVEGREGLGRDEEDYVLCRVRSKEVRGEEEGGEKPLSSEWVRQRVVKMVARAGVEGKVNPHDLRRTLAQLMRAAGVELEQVKEVLRHDSVRTTERYLGIGMELEKGKAGVDRVEWK